MAFEGLSEKLNNVFKRLKSRGKLNESDVKEAMREVRLALLEADVSYKVVKDFVAKITEKAYFLFLDMLKEELDGTGFNTEYIMRIRPKACASLSHIDNDILLRALKEACKEAHDGAAVHDI